MVKTHGGRVTSRPLREGVWCKMHWTMTRPYSVPRREKSDRPGHTRERPAPAQQSTGAHTRECLPHPCTHSRTLALSHSRTLALRCGVHERAWRAQHNTTQNHHVCVHSSRVSKKSVAPARPSPSAACPLVRRRCPGRRGRALLLRQADHVPCLHGATRHGNCTGRQLLHARLLHRLFHRVQIFSWFSIVVLMDEASDTYMMTFIHWESSTGTTLTHLGQARLKDRIAQELSVLAVQSTAGRKSKLISTV